MILESSCVTEDVVDFYGDTIRRVTTNVKCSKDHSLSDIQDTLTIENPQGFKRSRRSLWMRGRKSYNEINEVIVYQEI